MYNFFASENTTELLRSKLCIRVSDKRVENLRWPKKILKNIQGCFFFIQNDLFYLIQNQNTATQLKPSSNAKIKVFKENQKPRKLQL